MGKRVGAFVFSFLMLACTIVNAGTQVMNPVIDSLTYFTCDNHEATITVYYSFPEYELLDTSIKDGMRADIEKIEILRSTLNGDSEYEIVDTRLYKDHYNEWLGFDKLMREVGIAHNVDPPTLYSASNSWVHGNVPGTYYDFRVKATSIEGKVYFSDPVGIQVECHGTAIVKVNDPVVVEPTTINDIMSEIDALKGRLDAIEKQLGL